MINYGYFAAIAKLILEGDPKIQYDNFTVKKIDCDDTLRMIFDHCSSLNAYVRVNDKDLDVKVNYNPVTERYVINYRKSFGDTTLY